MTKSKISPQEAFDRLNAVYDIEYIDSPDDPVSSKYDIGIKFKNGPYRALLPSPAWEIDWPFNSRQYAPETFRDAVWPDDWGKEAIFTDNHATARCLSILCGLYRDSECEYWLDAANDCWDKCQIKVIPYNNKDSKSAEDIFETRPQGQPISTAPKDDGKEIRLLMGGEWLIGYWDKHNQVWFSRGQGHTWQWDEANQPTQWRPL